MAEIMMRLNRSLRTSSLTDFILVAIFIILALIFIQRRGFMNHVGTSSIDTNTNPTKIESEQIGRQGNEPSVHEIKHRASNHIIIDERIKKIPDTRPAQCKEVTYKTTRKVTIIVDFFDYQFYDLKTTLGSVLQYTPTEIIHEILVIDDGSTLEYIKQDSKAFVDKIRKAKILRLPNKVSIGRARMEAVKQATSEILVFLENNIICNEGWIQPLLHELESNHSAIVVPHFDNINDPVSYEYQSTAANLVTGFSWSLTMRMAQVSDNNDVTKPLDTAVMRGSAFIMTRKLFDKIGGFDEDIEDIGGQNIEMSFRTWMCGGSLKVLPCSRVGVLNLHDPVKIVNADTIRRISEVWLGDKKDLVYRNTGTQDSMSESEEKSIHDRKTAIQNLKCKNFDWYLKTAAKDIYTPSKDAKYYGILKCKTGRCAHIGNDRRVDLGSCKAQAYNLHTTDMLFEYDTKGLLKTQGKCLEVQNSAYVKLVECKEGETKQQYEYHNGGKLKNRWSGYCTMHVTDPDKKVPKGRQIMMAQDCGLDTSGEFVSWEFIMP